MNKNSLSVGSGGVSSGGEAQDVKKNGSAAANNTRDVIFVLIVTPVLLLRSIGHRQDAAKDGISRGGI
jgi:hypothetical protein